MAKPSMLFQCVWFGAAFLRRPVGGPCPHARAAQSFNAVAWSKSERREVQLLPSAPYLAPIKALQSLTSLPPLQVAIAASERIRCTL